MSRSLTDERSLPRVVSTPRGPVRVFKEVVSEVRTISVTVQREQLRIEPLRAAGTLAPALDTEPLVIPLFEEEVEVTTRPVLREEVNVGQKLEELARTPRKMSTGRGDPDGW